MAGRRRAASSRLPCCATRLASMLSCAACASALWAWRALATSLWRPPRGLAGAQVQYLHTPLGRSAIMFEQVQKNLEKTISAAIGTKVLSAVATGLAPVNARMDAHDEAIKSLQRQVFMGTSPRPVLGAATQRPYDQLKTIYAEHSQQGSQWTKNRDGKVTEIRARGDIPQGCRSQRRIIANTCPHIEAMCTNLAHWTENCYFRVSGYKGVMSLADQNDIRSSIQLVCINGFQHHLEADGVEITQ
ncbi:unnamed protein product [Prorocentrum cordatum]|uniref:Uncharacterized protein n=1 Tax=Prorocentrum cordatum TaxID=2364126 RepID=A0ABN9QZM3_9DINO|nr:unnamed protein product [Polarella glacialis]